MSAHAGTTRTSQAVHSLFVGTSASPARSHHTSLMSPASLALSTPPVCFADIHVEADNPGAQGMYESLGYVLEKEEEEWLAERMGRPRRLLLRKHIA